MNNCSEFPSAFPPQISNRTKRRLDWSSPGFTIPIARPAPAHHLPPAPRPSDAESSYIFSETSHNQRSHRAPSETSSICAEDEVHRSSPPLVHRPDDVWTVGPTEREESTPFKPLFSDAELESELQETTTRKEPITEKVSPGLATLVAEDIRTGRFGRPSTEKSAASRSHRNFDMPRWSHEVSDLPSTRYQEKQFTDDVRQPTAQSTIGPCIYKIADHTGETPCIYASFDPFLSSKCTPGTICQTTTFQAIIQLDQHGRWNILLKTLSEPQRGSGWLSPDEDRTVRTMLSSNHHVYVRISWLGSVNYTDRGQVYHGVAKWSAYCPKQPATLHVAAQRRTTHEERSPFGQAAALPESANLRSRIPTSSIRADSAEIDRLWDQVAAKKPKPITPSRSEFEQEEVEHTFTPAGRYNGNLHGGGASPEL